MRVHRCFAFLDLCGFTSYTDEQGDTAAVAALAQLRALTRAAAEDRGVRVTKWLGDGAMLSGLEPATVIHCAARIREGIEDEGPLPLRGGIAGGPVIMFEGDDYIGACVNLAAHLCSAAEPGQVLLSAAAATAEGVEVPSHPRAAIEVRGVQGPVEVHELGR
jgi:adenylate cyclase